MFPYLTRFWYPGLTCITCGQVGSDPVFSPQSIRDSRIPWDDRVPLVTIILYHVLIYIYIYIYILLYIIIYYYIYIVYVLIIAHMAFFWTLLGTLKDILTRQPGVFAESYVSCPFCKDNNTSSSFVWLCRFASRGIQNGPGCWCTQPTWMVGAWDWSWSRIDCYGWSHSLLEFFGSQWQPFRWEIPS